MCSSDLEIRCRKDHYQAATDFWRVMQEIMERRFRWNLRQVLATVAETERALTERHGRKQDASERVTAGFMTKRLGALRAFFAAVDAGVGAFAQGQSFEPETVKNVLRMIPPRTSERS